MGGLLGLPHPVASLSVCPLAPEQQEAQRPPGWEAPQAVQPAQQAAETCSAGCEYPQGICLQTTGLSPRACGERVGQKGKLGTGGGAGRKPPPHTPYKAAWGEGELGWGSRPSWDLPEEFPARWAETVISGSRARVGCASPRDRLCPHPHPPTASFLWAGRQVVEKALWNECLGVGREDLGLEP